MALYLGTRKSTVYLDDNIPYRLRFYKTIPVILGVLLITSDDFVLRDNTGVYLTVKESE